MYENFERIPPDEQARILESCLEEFALHGYEKASTNAMVKRANIPKGTLFFYFGSKKDLYLYLIDRAVERFVAFMSQANDELPSDLFERLLHRSKIRFQFALQEPTLYQFFYHALINTPEAIQSDLQSRYSTYALASRQSLYEGLDRSKFKDGIDIEQAIELVYLVLEGILSRYVGLLKKIQPDEGLQLVEKLTDECRGYFEILKQGMYK